MNTGVRLAVALSALVLLAGVAPVGGLAGAERTDDRVVADVQTGAEADVQAGAVADGRVAARPSVGAQYKVTLMNVTIETWLLRNATVVNATVDTVVVRTATTTEGVRRNVTLSNVTVGRFVVERGRLQNVTARKLVIRNRSVLNIPGGNVIDPKVKNETIERHQTRNKTVTGVVIDRVVLDAAVLCGNASIGAEVTGNSSFDPAAVERKPDIAVTNGTVGEALVVEGRAVNWSLGSTTGLDGSAANATMPDGCGQG